MAVLGCVGADPVGVGAEVTEVLVERMGREVADALHGAAHRRVGGRRAGARRLRRADALERGAAGGEDRELVDGVAFSIEPGIYIPGEIGVRSEVNVYLLPGRAVVTPAVIQREMFVV